MKYNFKGDFLIAGKPVMLYAEKPTAPGETGWRVWDAGMILAKMFESHVQPRQTVLDLGCGSGISGIAAALCGADVTLSDKAAVEARTMHNVALNGQNVAAAGGQCVFRVLDWQRLPPSSTPLSQVGLPYERYDFVVASDVLWAPVFIKPFLEVLRLTVRDSATTVIIVQKIRDPSIDEEFIATLPKAGFTLVKNELSTDVVDRQVSNVQTRIYTLRLI
jgi:predicted nicotinamide N-methyase